MLTLDLKTGSTSLSLNNFGEVRYVLVVKQLLFVRPFEFKCLAAQQILVVLVRVIA
jgi:hypothetical protein